MINVRNDLTADFVRSLINYDPITGILTWKKRVGNRGKGTFAGGFRKDGYGIIRINKVLYLTHRIIWLYMTGAWPKEEIDHKDTNPSNLKFDNLREATRKQNNQNIKGYGICSKGVVILGHNKYWARIYSNNIYHNLGIFKTEKEASEAYKKKAEELFGEFAYAK